jgi:hypothetical protein
VYIVGEKKNCLFWEIFNMKQSVFSVFTDIMPPDINGNDTAQKYFRKSSGLKKENPEIQL